MDKKAVVALAYQEAIVARVVSPLKLQSNHPCFSGGMARWANLSALSNTTRTLREKRV